MVQPFIHAPYEEKLRFICVTSVPLSTFLSPLFFRVFVTLQVNGVFAGHTALQASSQNGHEDTVRVLIRFGVDLEAEVRFFRFCFYLLVQSINFALTVTRALFVRVCIEKAGVIFSEKSTSSRLNQLH